MPRIPQYQRQDLPGAAFNPPSSGQRIGAAVSGLGNALFDISESVRKADRVYKAQQIEQGLSDDFDDAITTFSNRTDYDNFDADVDKILPNIKSKYDQIAGSDPKLQQALNLSFDHSTRELKRTLALKKTQLIVDGSKAQLDLSIEKSLTAYADAGIPEEREAIRNKIEIEAQMMADAKIISQQDVVNKMQAFDKESESLRADKLILSDPKLAKKELASKQFDLDSTTTQNKIEKADKRILYLEKQDILRAKEARAEAKRAETKLHDDEERLIGNAFMKGDYSKAYQMAFDSKVLKGDEKKVWANAIESQLDGATTKDDPDVKLETLANYQDMTERDILNVKGLTAATKEHFIDKKRTYDKDVEKDPLYAELKSAAKKNIVEQIKKGNMFTGYDPDSADKAFAAEVSLALILDNEKDRAKRIRMLTPGSKDYILDSLIVKKTPKQQLEEAAKRISALSDEVEPDAQPNSVLRLPGESPEEYLKRKAKLSGE